jgi:SLA1 homology domain 1, SHD1
MSKRFVLGPTKKQASHFVAVTLRRDDRSSRRSVMTPGKIRQLFLAWSLVLVGLQLGAADVAYARQWTDRSGSYSVEAELVNVEDGRVHLKKPDGKIVTVPQDRLSDADQRYLKSLSKGSREKEPSPVSKKPASGVGQGPAKNVLLKAGRSAIEQELAKRTRYAFHDVPLRGVLAHFEEANQIPIFLDQKSLHAIGLQADTPVTAQGEADSLEKALETLFKPLGLTWMIRDEVLFVTTPEYAQTHLETRVYRVLPANQNLNGLIQQIVDKVSPKSWDPAGGPGTILAWPLGALVVSQTYAVHHELEQQYPRLLQAVVPPEAKAMRRPVLARPTLKDILAQLAVCEFNATPLKTFVRNLAERNRIKVTLDEKSLEAAGLGPDTPITCDLRGLKLESELALIFDQLGVVWTVKENELVITTPTGEASRLLTIEYNVRDLVYAIEPPDNELVRRIILTSVAPAAWSHAGGPGSLSAAEDGGALKIKQTFRIHLQIDRLIDDIRLFGRT